MLRECPGENRPTTPPRKIRKRTRPTQKKGLLSTTMCIETDLKMRRTMTTITEVSTMNYTFFASLL
jgi:hypothetical protein